MDGCVLGNNLGHPLFENLRNGDWLIQYTYHRLKLHPNTSKFGLWLEKVLLLLTVIPRYLIPTYYELLVRCIYDRCVETIINKIPSLSGYNVASLPVSLALGSVQLVGVVKSAPLAPIKTGSPVCQETGERVQAASLAAGLPHFSHGVMRNWGRDTFIALRGLLLLLGRHNEAKMIILSYAGTLRHGLIPNLLGGGEISRYNCRDAFWWWLYSIVQYCQLVPEGENILSASVIRLYPTDDSCFSPASSQAKCVLADVIHEGLQKIFQGIDFLERNAGSDIDMHMKFEGFKVNAWVDRATGFIYGGNKFNCGTWMDKMGESEKAGTKGQPATPRDGGAVELQALAFACIRYLADDERVKSTFSFKSVSATNTSNETEVWTLSEWADKMKSNFDDHYFIGSDPSGDRHNLSLINRRNIYKDTLNSSLPWTDYQLRPNYAVGLCVAPGLCLEENLVASLRTTESVLFGYVGMKTLDPTDWKYNGIYDNSRDDDNANLSKGFNYHNGPEWLWLTGFFLRAKFAVVFKRRDLNDESQREYTATCRLIGRFLSRASEHIASSSWRGMTELTNENGAFCEFSCPTQSWSFATVIELINDLKIINAPF